MDDSPALEVIGQTGNCLRVTFVWQQDRFAHRIDVLSEDGAAFCLTSEEGDGKDLWPPSPPLQQLSMEEPLPGRRVALLVGMAGKNHWSVSVEEDSPSGSLVFDVACRVLREPDWLGSTYDVSDPAQIHAASDETATVRDLPVLITVEPGDGGTTLNIGHDGQSLSVVPSIVNVDPPTTVRWKYRVGLRP